jgi:hypothetical protein
MSYPKRFLAVLLLFIIGSVATCHLIEDTPAEPTDLVQMSPGTYAHTLGASVDVVKLDYPKGAIIQNTTGDISLNITLTDEASSIAIYIPPEFTFLRSDTTSVWTSITNNYTRISIGKSRSMENIAPSWWSVEVDGSIAPGNYAVKLFSVRAPDVCGRYFVKVFIDGISIGAENFPTIVVKGDLYPAYVSGRVLNADSGEYGVPVSASGKVVAEGKTAGGRTVKAQAYFNASANGNYIIYGLAAGTYNLTASASSFVPTTMSRTISVYPGQSLEGVDIYVSPSATISGTIYSKCASQLVQWGYNSSGRVPRPISVEILDFKLNSIAVLANYTNYDPSSVYFPFSFDGSTELDGHVPQDYAAYVSGLESGDYYLEAHATGYLQRDVVAVHVYNYSRSISIPFDLWRTSYFNVTVHFMDSQGLPAETLNNGTLSLKAYTLDGTVWGSSSALVPAGQFSWNMTITGNLRGMPAGTYVIEASFPGYSQTTLPQATLGGGCSVTSLSFDMVRAGFLNLTLGSINSQTPPQNVPWQCPDAAITIEAIDSLGLVHSGTGMQGDGLAPVFANVTDLPPDIYLVRAYTVGYVQTREYRVSVGLASASDMRIDLVKAARLNVTLTFRKETLEAPIDTYAHYNLTMVPVRIEVYDSLGVLVGANATYIPAEEPSSSVEVVGFYGYAGNPCLRWVNYYDTTDGSLQKDYGIPPGTYSVRVWVPGYVQAETATISMSPASIAGITLSLEFDRLAHVYGSIHGLDIYEDLIPLSWANVTAYGPVLMATSSMDGYYELWLVNGAYMLATSSLGYETQGSEIQVSTGWETPVDFNLKPPGGTVPELSAAVLTLPAVLIMICVSLHTESSEPRRRRE